MLNLGLVRRLGLAQGGTEEVSPESVAFQIRPRIEEEAEERHSETVLTDLEADGMRRWYLASIPGLRSLQGDSDEHFTVGLHDF